MRLQLATWEEVEAHLKRSTGIIIPIGSTEQHGPTGFIGTDALCPEMIAQGVGDKLDAMINEATLGDLPRLGGEILKGRVRGRVVVDVNA